MTFLMNASYMAAWSAELGEALHRRPLDMPARLYRTGDACGTPARRLLQQLIARERSAS